MPSREFLVWRYVDNHLHDQVCGHSSASSEGLECRDPVLQTESVATFDGGELHLSYLRAPKCCDTPRAKLPCESLMATCED